MVRKRIRNGLTVISIGLVLLAENNYAAQGVTALTGVLLVVSLVLMFVGSLATRPAKTRGKND